MTPQNDPLLVPAVLRLEQLDQELRAFYDFLFPRGQEIEEQLEYPYYVQVGDYFGSEFESEGHLCYEHAQTFTAKYGGEINEQWCSPEVDSPAMCEVCGRRLGPVSLTAEGQREELWHFQNFPFEECPDTYYDLANLVGDALFSADDQFRAAVLMLRTKVLGGLS